MTGVVAGLDLGSGPDRTAVVVLRPDASPERLSAGTYLRLFREAAGFTLAGVDRACVSAPVDIDAAIEALANAEADRELLTDADLIRLAHTLRLDPAVYRALADASGARRCVSCNGAPSHAWEWADPDRTCCIACASTAA